MNKNKLKKIELVEEILNNNKHIFEGDIEYIIVEFKNDNISYMKTRIEIYKKIDNGLVFAGQFPVYENKTYKDAVNNYILFCENN